MVEEEKKITFCKKYEAHNRTFWFIYPLLGFNVDLQKYVKLVVNKSNLYIQDDEYPNLDYNNNMVIYAIEFKEFCEELDKEIFIGYLVNNPKYICKYEIDNIHCFVYEFKDEKAQIYRHFKNGEYSKMNIKTLINFGYDKEISYADVFKSYSEDKYQDSYLYRIYHIIKKTDLEKLKFNTWLKKIGVNQVSANTVELESIINNKEEILRYGGENSKK